MIGQGLSIDQSPPLHCSGRFFISAPLFVIYCTILLLIENTPLPTSYLSVEVIALTHSFTLGFILFNMIGALFQLLPVLAGTPLPKPVLLATIVHAGLFVGVIGFITGLFYEHPLLIHISAIIVVISLVFFVTISVATLLKSKTKNPVTSGMIYALVSLLFVILFGYLLSFRHTGQEHPFSQMTILKIHLLFAFSGWIGILILTVAFKIIPMFFVTPEYPAFVQKHIGRCLFYFNMAAAILIFLSDYFAASKWAYLGLLFVIISIYIYFAIQSFRLLQRRKRKLFDPAILFWKTGLAFFPIGMILFIVANAYISANLFILAGIVVIMGVIVTIILAMIYKIVPFLVWYGLFSLGMLDAPNMKQIITASKIRWQMILNLLSLVLLPLATIWNPLYPFALISLLISMTFLFYQLTRALMIYYKKSNHKSRPTEPAPMQNLK